MIWSVSKLLRQSGKDGKGSGGTDQLIVYSREGKMRYVIGEGKPRVIARLLEQHRKRLQTLSRILAKEEAQTKRLLEQHRQRRQALAEEQAQIHHLLQQLEAEQKHQRTK